MLVPDSVSCRASPVQAYENDGPIAFSIISSIALMPFDELTCGASTALTEAVEYILYLFTFACPRVSSTDAKAANGTISPLSLRTLSLSTSSACERDRAEPLMSTS